MAWNLDSDRPIFAQLAERIQIQIVSGNYPPGGKLPSVRELAAMAAVNPNTMQKAFSELERSGLIITQRTNGRQVTEDTELIRSSKALLAKGHVEAFLSKMEELGYTGEEVVALCTKIIEGQNGAMPERDAVYPLTEADKGEA